VSIEGIILTGGSSRRMGEDKALKLIGGIPVVEHITREMQAQGLAVTILGPGGQPDVKPGIGPLPAIADFRPKEDFVFVASCDLPLFDGRIIPLFSARIGYADGVAPIVDGRIQPLCGLYGRRALNEANRLHRVGNDRIMNWIAALSVVPISSKALEDAQLNPKCVRSANTPEEWAALVASSE
jgi:molybdopterin-guanine dinucleotide biosynthesis protein A